MKAIITVGSPRFLDVVGRDRQIMRRTIAEEAEHEMRLTLTSTEAYEVLRRLQGMPGIPDIDGAAPPEQALAELSRHFQRRIDLD